MTRRAALLIAVIAMTLGTVGCGDSAPVSTNKDLQSKETQGKDKKTGKDTKSMSSEIPNPK